MHLVHIVLCFLCLCSYAFSSSLPSFITPCNIDQDEKSLSRCLLDEGRKVQKQFIGGIPELGIETMDPLSVGEVDIITGTIKIRQKNVIVKGASKLEIREIVANMEKSSGRIVAFGNLTATSEYEVDGRLLLLPISGKGTMRIKMENTELMMKYKTKLVRGADGKDHVFGYDLKNTHQFGHVRIKMDGLFGNDKTLGDAMNQVLNENWRDIMKEFGPPSVKAVTEKALGIMNKFYAQVPQDELFVHK